MDFIRAAAKEAGVEVSFENVPGAESLTVWTQGITMLSASDFSAYHIILPMALLVVNAHHISMAVVGAPFIISPSASRLTERIERSHSQRHNQ